MKVSISAAAFYVPISLVLASACLGQQLAAAGEQKKAASNNEESNGKVVRSDGSTITGNHYWNPYFGFSIELPKDWIIAPQKEVETMQKKNIENLTKDDPELMEKGARALVVSAPPLVVVENNPKKDGFNRRGFELLASDVSAETNPSEEAYLKAAAQLMREKKLPVEYLGPPEKVLIDGRILWKAKLKETTNGHVQYARQDVAILKKCAVQFVLVGPEDEGLEELEPVIQSLHFYSSPS